jgi:hypothetical protein
VLGVSVTALDKWVGRGLLPVVRRPGSSRQMIETDVLLDLAEEVEGLREAGDGRGLLAAAFARLEREGRLRVDMRPNQSARELREQYRQLSPADRLRDGRAEPRPQSLAAQAAARQ